MKIVCLALAWLSLMLAVFGMFVGVIAWGDGQYGFALIDWVCMVFNVVWNFRKSVENYTYYRDRGY